MLMFYSCSTNDKSSILEHIPAEAKNIFLVNFKNVLLQSGGDITSDGELILSESAKSLLHGNDEPTGALVDFICKNARFIDVENMFWYKMTESSAIINIFKIKDYAKLKENLLLSGFVGEEADGYLIYDMGSCQMALNKSFGWISRDLEQAIAIEKKIGHSHIASFDPVKEFLENNMHDIQFVVNLKDKTSEGIHYMLGFASFKNTGLFAEISLMDNEGKIYQFRNNIHEVDRNLLKYIPGQTQLLFAIGKVDDWSILFEEVEKFIPKNLFSVYQLYYQVAKEYIAQIDGTTLFAGAPIAGRQALRQFSLDTWQVLVMSHFPQEITDELIQTVINFLSMQNTAVKEVSEGIYQTKLQGTEVMFGNVNGYLFFSNYDILEGGNTDLATAYESKRAVAEFLIPNGSETMKACELPWGLDLNLSLNADNGMVVLRLPGANGPVLKELVDFAAQSGNR